MLRPRRCVDCGKAQERHIVFGKETTNLDPISGKCLDCLAAHAKQTPKPPSDDRFDVRLAQTGEKE